MEFLGVNGFVVGFSTFGEGSASFFPRSLLLLGEGVLGLKFFARAEIFGEDAKGGGRRLVRLEKHFSKDV